MKWLTYHSLRAHLIAPVWLRIPKRLRWRIVDRLDRSPRYCWTDLVTAALAEPEDDACDVHLPAAESRRCQTVCGWLGPDPTQHAGEHPCGCYCGKFRDVPMRREP